MQFKRRRALAEVLFCLRRNHQPHLDFSQFKPAVCHFRWSGMWHAGTAFRSLCWSLSAQKRWLP